MRYTFTGDAEQYAGAAESFLAGDPVRHNVLLTTIEACRAGAPWGGAPLFGWAVDVDGSTAGAFQWTPPYLPSPSVQPGKALDALVEALRTAGHDLPGVVGVRGPAYGLADRWCAASGRVPRPEVQMLAHVLHEVTRPRQPAGKPRPARPEEANLLTEWVLAFQAESGAQPAPDVAGYVEARTAAGLLFVWDDGEPVSLAGRNVAVASIVRVGPVYTPPERRGRGYARALVAEVSSRALAERNAACMLFTDVSNPTSNAIYRQVGYVPVEEAVELRFVPG